MPEYRLSRLALSDLRSIGESSVRNWSPGQAETYLTDIGRILTLLSANPMPGRSCEKIRKGYRRMEHGRYVIFYLVRDDGIDVIRILHDRMLPKRHFDEE
ncbi:MAG: type II toxin-antitoxin system RelE/ParE family toxin [Acidobacteriaceae bacterium]